MSRDFTSTAKRVLGWPLVFAAYVAVFALFMQGCGWNDFIVPDDPVPPIHHDPVDPIDPPQPAPVGNGQITEAQYALPLEGLSETEIVKQLGPPFKTNDAAGFHILIYDLGSGEASYFVKDGTVVRKSRFP